MTTYIATFSTGKTITRTSDKVYTHAWLATWEKEGATCCDYGFASSEELAQKAARPNLPCCIARGMSAKQKKQAEEYNNKFLAECNLKIEIVKL